MSFDIGQAHVLLVKSAGDSQPVTTHSLSGELYLSRSGWLLLNVPNALVRGAFAALNEPGAELPPSGDDGQLRAHISVIRPEELESIGLTGDDIKERGKHFHYTLGPVQEVVPAGWDSMSKCWFIKVTSPELKQLRRTYGLTPLPNHDKYDFHITIGVRRKGVLGTNEIRKLASLIHDPDGYFSKTAYTSAEASQLLQRLRAARRDVNRKPTPAQQEAGNYRKGHVTLHGLDIAIENPKGSVRSGISPDGKEWSTKMVHDYGYFKQTEDKDGDPIDVFIGPTPHSELVFIINQVHPGGRFDEHKVMLGFVTADDAREGYLANYEDGWQGLGGMVGMTMEDFKEWLEGDTTKRACVLKQAADDFWKSPKNKDGRRCPGCNQLFKECEPLAGVTMCEVCERYGPSKTKQAAAAERDPREGSTCPHCGSTDTIGARAMQKDAQGRFVRFANAQCQACNNGFSYDFSKQAAAATFRATTSYNPICPHCHAVMHERHFVPDQEHAKLWRHRGACYDKGAFEIHWPDQATKDAEYDSFMQQLGLAKQAEPLMPEEDNGRDGEEWTDPGQRPTDRPNQSGTTTTTGTGITGPVQGSNSSDLVGGSGSPAAVRDSASEQPFSEDSVLAVLQQAKQRSDQRQYQEKYRLIRQIMSQSPQDFVVDSPVGKYHGITHVPTQFRFHVPPFVYNGLLKSAEVWDSTWYGRAARDYFNNMIAGRQPLWNSGQGVLGNIGQHLGNVRDIASKRIAQAGAQQRLQMATDPDYALRHLSAYLGGRQQPIVNHPLDAVLHGRFGS